MTAKNMAKTLYGLLLADSSDCYDTSVSLNDTRVYYEDQGGEVCYDFSRKTICVEGDIRDTFGVETKEEMADFVNTRTVELSFWKNSYGQIIASHTEQFETFEEMKSVMKEGGVCMYLDLDKVFK